MRLLLYEHLTASIGSGPVLPPSLAIEGWAMLSALLQDCCAIANVEPHTLIGPDVVREIPAIIHRVDPARGWLAGFVEVLRDVDAVLIIAPEFERILETLVRTAEDHQKCVIGCSSGSVASTADKLNCCRILREHGVRTPDCQEFQQAQIDWTRQNCTYPAVLKPRDGAGSLATILVGDASQVESALAAVQQENPGQTWILQSFVPGQPASVSCIVYAEEVITLPAATQQLSTDGRFRYEGGLFPLDAALQGRAQRIARNAVSAIGGLRGYVGVDLILGASEDGRDDYVIEINPRITTSYLALRSLCRQNLLKVILAACMGQDIEPLSWKAGSVRFQADGSSE